MKDFILKHKKIIAFSAIALLLAIFTTTTGISSLKSADGGSIDEIRTCSTPQGEIVAHGIDVSKYQGEINFEKVKSDGYSFVILRAGTTQGGKDANFDTYYKNAKAAGLDIGCYYYTYATTVEGAKEEALRVRRIIKGKTFTYPVFLDFEYQALQSYDRIDINDAMINTFCKYIKRGGYYPGVYTSSSIYNSYINKSELGNIWDFWIASYRDDTHSYEGYQCSFSMWQYTSNGTVSGIDARVDLNVSYVDYPKLIDEFQQKLNKYT